MCSKHPSKATDRSKTSFRYFLHSPARRAWRSRLRGNSHFFRVVCPEWKQAPLIPFAPTAPRRARPTYQARGSAKRPGSKATRPPMFVLTLDRGLLRFALNTPALPPLFQLPPRYRHRYRLVPIEKGLCQALDISAQQPPDFIIESCPNLILLDCQRRRMLPAVKVFIRRHLYQLS